MPHLILGDLHGQLPDLDLDQDSPDGIITTGDYGFNQQQRSAFAGARTRENQYRAAQNGINAAHNVLDELNQYNAPVYTVSGNWDFTYDDLISSHDSIQPADETCSTDEYSIVGFPADKFNTGPEIPYDQFGVDADTFEDAFSSYRDSDISLEELAEELAVGEQHLQNFCEQYEEDYQELKDRFTATDPPRILLSHNPPFNTALDRIDDPDNPKHGENYGSIIVKELIHQHQPDMSISGPSTKARASTHSATPPASTPDCVAPTASQSRIKTSGSKNPTMQIDNLAEDADSFTANAFLLSETALIDTGSDPIVLERLDSIDQVAITHTHHDHIENLPQIVDQHSPTIYAYEPDNLPVDAEQVQDRDNIDLAGSSFNILHTPGHKDDSICLFHEKSGTLFSGDLIFPNGSFGRTDLEEGNRDTLIKSIERITHLDVQALYPGHDSPTTTDVNQQIQQSLEEAKKREPKY